MFLRAQNLIYKSAVGFSHTAISMSPKIHVAKYFASDELQTLEPNTIDHFSHTHQNQLLNSRTNV